ncbi:MAG: lipase family protein [Planctomycetaceae bacterium]
MLPALDPTVGRNYQNARFLATACDLAYFPAAEGVEKFRSTLGLKARLVEVDNTQVYICENEGAIVAAFRGTESPATLDGFKDWLLTNARNFLVLPEGRAGTDFAAAGVGARFHHGFLQALEEVWSQFYTAIDDAVLDQERPVWLTGHSLGGALALLAAWRLQKNFVKVHQVCTFGAPMIGNSAAAEAFHREFPGRIFRYVDTRDLVPKLPTMSLASNEYSHCLTEIPLGPAAAEDVIGNMARQTVDKVLEATWADELWTKTFQGVDCHLMANYIGRIEEQMG